MNNRDTYTPRRASKRWLDGAPAYVLDVMRDGPAKDPHGYFVLFTGELYDRKPYRDAWVQGLEINNAPTHPAYGVSLWTELRAHEAAAYRYSAKHRRVRWLDVPAELRAHIQARAESDQ